jgi:hypothetical protein
MRELRESISNYASHPDEEYYRRIIRKKIVGAVESATEFEGTVLSTSSREVYTVTMGAEEIIARICSHILSSLEEYGSKTSSSREDILSILRELHSSKEYSVTRTSPVINKLNQVWLVSAIGGGRLIDVNRVHRTLFFDIASSDPVEDYIQFGVVGKRGDIRQVPRRKLPPEVLPFCTKEGISHYVLIAIDLIERNFPEVDKVEMQVEEDPETGEKWLLIEIVAHGRLEEVVENYNRYTECWISSVPWPERHKIRLSFAIV